MCLCEGTRFAVMIGAERGKTRVLVLNQIGFGRYGCVLLKSGDEED